jgi:hypothetical protein
MKMPVKRIVVALTLAGMLLGVAICGQADTAEKQQKDNVAPSAFRALFNGKDFTGWKIPEGDNGHWKIIDGAIDYDAESQAKGDKSLWHTRHQADKPVGQWNRFEITIRGDRVTVVLNGIKVIDKAQLPGIAQSGPIALQHHGGKRDGQWNSPPSLLQFKNIFIKELK